jgi:hypothetical protein
MFDTGMQPPGSPVQAEFSLVASGNATVTARAVASDADLYGLPGTGKLAISGGFAMDAKLHVDITGLPSYDGGIPGIENVAIAVEGSQPFEPFSIGEEVAAHAPIPPTTLPKIPLPGGLPGSLVLTIADGSFVDVTFDPRCAGVSGGKGVFDGTITRGGTLVIQPSIEIDIPIKGTQTFDIPSFTVDLGALGSSDVEASAAVDASGDPPSDAVKGTPHCNGDGGSGGAGSTAETTSSTGDTSATSSTGGGGTCTMPLAPSDCASCPDATSCLGTDTAFGCCDNAVPGGYYALEIILINDCACKIDPDAICHSACSGSGDICQEINNPISQGCSDCLQGLSSADTCVVTGEAEAQADPDAKAYLDCTNACPF